MYDTTKPYIEKIEQLCKNTVPKTTTLAVHVDGIGTKGVYHWKAKTFHEAVIDALAMNLNDMVAMRVEPFAIADHLMLPEDNHQTILTIIEELCNECSKRNLSILGGETSIHYNLTGMELSITMLGWGLPTTNEFREGDALIGIASSGLHSNGFTKVHELYKNEIKPEFTEPTLIYSDAVREIYKNYDIHYMAHITGGGYIKLLRHLLRNLDIVIYDYFELPIFYEIYNKGVSDKEMYKTFNCGTGFVLATQDNINSITARLKEYGFEANIIGYVTKGKGKLFISSQFSNAFIHF